MQRSIEEIEKEAQRLAGCQFNLGSSAEVSNILFNVLKLAVPPNAKPLRGGKLYSTGAEVWFVLNLSAVGVCRACM